MQLETSQALRETSLLQDMRIQNPQVRSQQVTYTGSLTWLQAGGSMSCASVKLRLCLLQPSKELLHVGVRSIGPMQALHEPPGEDEAARTGT